MNVLRSQCGVICLALQALALPAAGLGTVTLQVGMRAANFLCCFGRERTYAAA
jgi:hypothetical protein